MKSFLKQKNPRVLSQEEIAFTRNLRWKELKKKINVGTSRDLSKILKEF